jgi:hypothetical protein
MPETVLRPPPDLDHRRRGVDRNSPATPYKKAWSFTVNCFFSSSISTPPYLLSILHITANKLAGVHHGVVNGGHPSDQ